MSDAAVSRHIHMPGQSERFTLLGVFGIIFVGAIYAGYHLVDDLSSVPAVPFLPYALLGVALLIALGFEFVNGFHDTANAVATVIYTHSLPAYVAVVWSGLFNLFGVLVSSGAVAFGIISLLPVELILHVGSSAGFAMVFSLLIAAIIWNLGTWYFGLPNSSSHTLIGSIMGVGLMNSWLSPVSGTAGVDWDQVAGVGRALGFSPLIGFAASALLLLLSKALIRIPKLYTAPVGSAPAAVAGHRRISRRPDHERLRRFAARRPAHGPRHEHHGLYRLLRRLDHFFHHRHSHPPGTRPQPD